MAAFQDFNKLLLEMKEKEEREDKTEEQDGEFSKIWFDTIILNFLFCILLNPYLYTSIRTMIYSQQLKTKWVTFF